MSETDRIRRAATELVEAMCECQCFDVEFGAAGEGPLVKLVQALGISMPAALRDFIEEEVDDV